MIIVSGLERSGTSLMMQILEDAGFDLCYDDKRKPDIHNPKGYLELEDGKIIISLMDNTFDKSKYQNRVIKITSYGIPMLEGNDYQVIYMMRNLDEVIDSQNKMVNENFSRHMDLHTILNKMNIASINHMEDNNIEYILIDYNKLLTDPENEIKKLSDFLGKDISKSIRVIDKNLYRNRRN